MGGENYDVQCFHVPNNVLINSVNSLPECIEIHNSLFVRLFSIVFVHRDASYISSSLCLEKYDDVTSSWIKVPEESRV